MSGWGRTIPGDPSSLSVMLRHAQVVPVDYQPCRLPFRIFLYKSRYIFRSVMGDGAISAGMICAGAGGRDTCNGDSGGPLVTRHSNSGGYSAIGITSWGIGCARPDTLGVYANVAHYMDWVAQQFGYSGIGPNLSTIP